MKTLLFNNVPNFSMKGFEALLSWRDKATKTPDRIFRKIASAVGLVLVGVAALVETIALAILAGCLVPALAFGRYDSEALIGASGVSLILCASSLTLFHINNIFNEVHT